jgi:hypothetical protein
MTNACLGQIAVINAPPLAAQRSALFDIRLKHHPEEDHRVRKQPEVVVSMKECVADIDRLSAEIDAWDRDFIELLGAVTHWDMVFTETAEMRPSYIALCDWDNPSQLLVVQTIPFAASEHQLNMTRAIVSIITALLYASAMLMLAWYCLVTTRKRFFVTRGLPRSVGRRWAAHVSPKLRRSTSVQFPATYRAVRRPWFLTSFCIQPGRAGGQNTDTPLTNQPRGLTWLRKL